MHGNVKRVVVFVFLPFLVFSPAAAAHTRARNG